MGGKNRLAKNQTDGTAMSFSGTAWANPLYAGERATGLKQCLTAVADYLNDS
jgi:hypothetical protein